MLNWVCPKCSREVGPGVTRCPFCGFEEEKPQAAAGAADATTLGAPVGAPPRTVLRRVIVRRKSMEWGPWLADVERGFRFGLGFVAALAVTYFVLYLIAYYGGYGEWADKLAQWLRMR